MRVYTENLDDDMVFLFDIICMFILRDLNSAIEYQEYQLVFLWVWLLISIHLVFDKSTVVAVPVLLDPHKLDFGLYEFSPKPSDSAHLTVMNAQLFVF